MVDVEFQPVRKIVVHEAIKYSFDDFVKRHAIQQPPNMPQLQARWVDGVIFIFNGMQPTPELINDRVRNGVVHWDFIMFASMPEFQNMVTHPDTQMQLRVNDNSSNTAVADVIRYFKSNPTFFPSGA